MSDAYRAKFSRHILPLVALCVGDLNTFDKNRLCSLAGLRLGPITATQTFFLVWWEGGRAVPGLWVRFPASRIYSSSTPYDPGNSPGQYSEQPGAGAGTCGCIAL